MVMNLEDELLQRLRELPPEKRREVLDFTNRLRQPNPPKTGKSLAGLWSKYNVDLSADDFKQLRREMWANFPRGM